MKRAEKKSTAVQQKIAPAVYEMLFHEANDAILLVDGDSWKVISANQRMQELSGYVKAEIDSLDVKNFYPKEESHRSVPLSEDLLTHNGLYEDICLKKKDGYLAFATLSVRKLEATRTGGQNIVFCILHDIGEKKTMERDLLTKHWELKNAYADLQRTHIELKNAQESLVQAGKLAALGELAAGVAHELNQPLLGVMGFSQEALAILKEKYPGEATLADHLEEIGKNSLRMKKIIQQLREFTRKSVEDMQNADIESVIRESLELLGQQFKTRGIEVTLKKDKDVPEIYCNPFQLEQVFINLATNARDAIDAQGEANGKIEIEVRRAPEDKKRFIEVVYRDNGCGMEISTQNRAMEPFFTTKEVGKGMGLGLSVSYGIIGKIHGTMMIESKPGKGTSFRIKLPIDYRALYAGDGESAA